MIEFHPLADLFPLIDGAEFDELVTSIRENGLREAIVTFDGKILDGRNRYRACLAANVFPRLEIFDGPDPVRFVIDKNIHRRHLNESQRGLIAARLASLKLGSNQFVVKGDGIPAPSQASAAGMMNVSRDTVTCARKVLDFGTSEEIKAAESGQRGVSGLADEIRARQPRQEKPKPKQNKSQSGKNPERIQRQQINAEIWGRVRDALVHLTSLPRPLEVIPIARVNDRTGLVDARVLQALQWLEDFSDGWTIGDEAQARKAGTST